MRKKQKRIPQYSLILLISVLCTLLSEILERVTNGWGSGITLNAGPIGFDFHIVQFSMMVNPGTIIGFLLGFLMVHLLRLS